MQEVAGRLVVKALNYGVRGCGFESHQLLPRKYFLQSLWFPFHMRAALDIRLPAAQSCTKGEIIIYYRNVCLDHFIIACTAMPLLFIETFLIPGAYEQPKAALTGSTGHCF